MKKTKHNIIINLYDTDTYADYGYENHEQLNEELSNKIITLANTKAIKDNLLLRFKTNSQQPLEEGRFRTAYQNTIKNKIEMKKNEISRCAMIGSVQFLFSIALIFFLVFVAPSMGNTFYIFFEIFTWVFAWCAIEMLTIHMSQLIIDKLKFKRLLKATIQFDISTQDTSKKTV